MPEIVAEFVTVFVPLFVALSPLTVLPIFLTMTEGMDVPAMRRLSHRAVATGFVLATALVVLGQLLFRFLGITVDDLRVAGGLILLVISAYDLAFSHEERKQKEVGDDQGFVPLGTPLIVGPATMTTCVVLADAHGKTLVIIALSIILAFQMLILDHAHRIKNVVPSAVSRAFGKVMSLFLAAIAVAMLRSGVVAFVKAAMQDGG